MFGFFVPRYTVRRMYLFPRGFSKRDWSKINEGPLKKAGLLARKIERGLIRKDISKKQTPSRPGRPPKSRHPQHLFRQIFSDVDALNTNVIIGHENLSGAKQTPMEIHEFGQVIQIKEISKQKNRRRIKDAKERARVRKLFVSGRLISKPTKRVTRSVKMPERPFAYPTTVLVAKRLPPLWANSVTKGTVRQ